LTFQAVRFPLFFPFREKKMKQIAARRSKECGHRRRDPWLMDRLSYRRRQFAVRFFDEKLKESSSFG
jgi:hypothetical protein